jgi:hypothetical protein
VRSKLVAVHHEAELEPTPLYNVEQTMTQLGLEADLKRPAQFGFEAD